MMIVRKIDNSTTIYIVDICTDIISLEERITLSSNEILYYSKINSIKRRCEWLTSRIAIREIFGDKVTTDYKEKAPILIGSDKFISISHCKDKLTLMVADKRCGIDIEKIDYDFSRVAKRFLSSDELSYLTKEDIALAWTIKEAAYKIIGVKDVDFSTMFKIKEIDHENKKTILTYNNTNYNLYFFQIEGYNICYGINII